MTRPHLPLALLLLLLLVSASPAPAQQSIGAFTRGMERQEGLFSLYWDAANAKLYMEIARPGEEFLYLPSRATGLGAPTLGLDRGQIQDEQIARFDRHGPRVHLVLTNPRFRAVTENPALVRSVDESFAPSTIASLDVAAADGDRALVDMTPFLLSDLTDVRGSLRRGNGGTFQLDRDRSAVHMARTRAFPRNTELEASLTFTSDTPGAAVRQHLPDGRAITVRQHVSLVRLPEPGFTPRRFDPRIGIFSVAFRDYAQPFDRDYVVRHAVRHRLIKRDPTAQRSEPVEPIVYYLDPAIPDPYRSAFREGAMWWNRVFEAAGFIDAFRVEDMPADMDPMDARYHVIQWVHRTAPGSSIGPSFVDPRTGEVIKAGVRMDSHRSLVDYDLYAGVLPATAAADAEVLGPWLASLDPAVTAEEFAMARRRQHAAHEVGHTLGLAHNFVATSYGRASVMDYPAPLIKLAGDSVDLTDAYRSGPGAYDSIAIRYAYTPFATGEEDAGLQAIVAEAMDRGLAFITNPDERAASAYPEATTWVNGSDMVAELERVMRVRRVLLQRFDETAIRPGEPMALLNRRFVTAYLHHRFTLGAAIKAIGGLEFRYAMRGDPLPPTRLVDPARQRRALELLLDALEPEELAIPERVLSLMAPRPFGYSSDERGLRSAAGPAFDHIGAARTLATTVLGGIFEPERAARLVVLSHRAPESPALETVAARIVERTWGEAPGGRHATLQRVVQRAVVDELIRLAADDDAIVEARAVAEWALRRIANLALSRGAPSPADEAHQVLVHSDIMRFLERRDGPTPRSDALAAPPGTPIGK